MNNLTRVVAILPPAFLVAQCLGCGGNNPRLHPPSSLSYATNPAMFTLGTTITPDLPRHQDGAPDSYSVTPDLPDGLTLDTVSGAVSGTPTVIKAAQGYTVTATNVAGDTTVVLTLTVYDMAPSDLSYAVNPAVFTRGTAIAPDLPGFHGGAPTAYTVSPALPSGLALDAASGAITGTPSAATPTTVSTVTASNPSGKTTVGLSITVN